nr:hypothetical protein [Brevibacterium aurantiacum]
MRATAMSLWQLDAFEYNLTNGETITIYQLLDVPTETLTAQWRVYRRDRFRCANSTCMSLGLHESSGGRAVWPSITRQVLTVGALVSYNDEQV